MFESIGCQQWWLFPTSTMKPPLHLHAKQSLRQLATQVTCLVDPCSILAYGPTSKTLSCPIGLAISQHMVMSCLRPYMPQPCLACLDPYLASAHAFALAHADIITFVCVQDLEMWPSLLGLLARFKWAWKVEKLEWPHLSCSISLLLRILFLGTLTIYWYIGYLSVSNCDAYVNIND